MRVGSIDGHWGEAESCLIANNTLVGNDGGLLADNCVETRVDSNLFWNNSWELAFSSLWERTVAIDWNLLPTPVANVNGPLHLLASGNRSGDPLLRPDFSPAPGSPAIDGGYPLPPRSDGEEDYHGARRVEDGRIDIGAVEFLVALHRDGFE